MLRTDPIRSTKVTRSAKGQTCTARFPGICNDNPEKTVWAHLNGARFGKGAGTKAHDVLGFHCCSDCHFYYDVGHGTRPILSNDTLLECVLGAVCETWVRLIRDGLVVVPQDAPKRFHDKPVKARKPREQRRAIQQRTDAWPPKGSRKIGVRRERAST